MYALNIIQSRFLQKPTEPPNATAMSSTTATGPATSPPRLKEVEEAAVDEEEEDPFQSFPSPPGTSPPPSTYEHDEQEGHPLQGGKGNLERGRDVGSGKYLLKKRLQCWTPTSSKGHQPVPPISVSLWIKEGEKSSGSNSTPLGPTQNLKGGGTAQKMVLIPQDSSSAIHSRHASHSASKKSVVEKTTSSFVSKIVAHENLARYLYDAKGIYTFYGCGSSFVWMDYSYQSHEPWTVIYFREAQVTCHALNPQLRDTLDVVIGFNGGDVMFYSPVSGKYSRINRNGAIHKACVTCVHWIPGLPTHVMVAFSDGKMMVLDAEREDGQYLCPPLAEGPFQPYVTAITSSTFSKNPVYVFNLSSKAISSFSYSPDGSHVAVASMDGELFILDGMKFEILDIFHSWYGALLCQAWSPDGKYIIAGGHDDLISIWHWPSKKCVARCQGHHAWVTAVQFCDSECTHDHYQFTSVGEDSRMLFWEFDSHGLSHKARPLTARRRTTGVGRSSSASSVRPTSPEILRHPIATMNQVSVLQPISNHRIQASPIVGFYMLGDALATFGNDASLHLWQKFTPP